MAHTHPATYKELFGNTAIEMKIQRCLKAIDERAANAFDARFKTEKGTHLMHTYRELLVGAYLRNQGFRMKHEPKLAGMTPDWAIVSDSDTVECIVEVVSYEIDNKTNSHIIEQLQTFQSAGYFVDSQLQDKRLGTSLRDKCSKYKSLAEAYKCGFVIAVYTSFLAAVTTDELLRSISVAKVFYDSVELSGVLHFSDNASKHYFNYSANTDAIQPFDIPHGVLE